MPENNELAFSFGESDLEFSSKSSFELLLKIRCKCEREFYPCFFHES